MSNINQEVINQFNAIPEDLKVDTLKILADNLRTRNKRESITKGVTPKSFQIGQLVRVKVGASVPKKWWGQVLPIFHVDGSTHLYLENPKYPGQKYKCVWPLTNEVELVEEIVTETTTPQVEVIEIEQIAV